MHNALALAATSAVANASACYEYTCGHITRSPYAPVKRALFLHLAEVRGLGSLLVRTDAPEVVAALALMRAGAECREVVALMTDAEVAAADAAAPTGGDPSALSPEVLGVMALVTEGLSYPEIAAARGIATETVRSHVKRAMRATGDHNAVASAVSLVEEGLI